MVSKLGWEDVHGLLDVELRKSRHIMTFGTIGSLNIEHDIDVIITKKPESSIRAFYEEVHKIFQEVDSYLFKHYKIHSFCFSSSQENFIIPYLSEGQKFVGFHTHAYMNYPSIERDWNWALLDQSKVRKIISENYKCILGKSNFMFSKEFSKSSYYDHLFLFLYQYDKVNSYYPTKLLLEIMNHNFDYFYRKELGLKSPIAKNKEDISKYFYQLCDVLDELRKKK